MCGVFVSAGKGKTPRPADLGERARGREWRTLGEREFWRCEGERKGGGDG